MKEAGSNETVQYDCLRALPSERQNLLDSILLA
jgi:hypothetical protein